MLPMETKTEIIYTMLLIIIATLFGFIIRLHFINFLSIRLDEAQSLYQANRSLTGSNNLFIYMAADVHPPLYNLILHFWINKFGTSAAIARLPSVIAGVISIPLVYFLIKEIYSRKEAIVGLFIAAFNPIWLWHSMEIKNYSFLILATVLSFLFYFKLIHGKRQWYFILLYIISQIFGLYIHYFFIFVIFIQFIGCIIYKSKLPILLNIIPFITFVPWALFFLHYHSSTTQPNLGILNLFNIQLTISQLFVGYHAPTFYNTAISLWPLLILLIFVYIRAFNNINKDSIIVILGLILPITITYLISVFYINVFLTRYLIFTSLFLFILIAKIVTSPKLAIFKFIGSSVLIVFLLTMTVSQITDANNISNEDYRSAISYIQQKANNNDMIVVSAAFTIYPFQYYYTGTIPYETLPPWNRKEAINFNPTASQMQELVDNMKSTNNMYLIESYDQSFKNSTVKWFNTHLKKIGSKSFGYNVSVYEYKINYNQS